MTLMVNRSDRRFQTLSPTRAREAARLIENEARGNPSRPGASSDARQYMTATEFRIASDAFYTVVQALDVGFLMTRGKSKLKFTILQVCSGLRT